METRSQRRSRNARSSSHLASVVELLVDSGHVQVAEVGKLAQTCRKVNRACIEESVWASLCKQEWPSVACIPESCVNSIWMYRQWCTGPAAKRRPPTDRLGPPSCTVDQLQLHLNVKYKDTLVCSDVITGNALREYLSTCGAVGVKLYMPFSVGKAEWSSTDVELDPDRNGAFIVGCSDLDRDSIDFRVHLLRTTDSTMCCLVNSQDNGIGRYDPLTVHPLLEEGQTMSHSADFDHAKEQGWGRLVTKPTRMSQFNGLPLRDSTAAAEIRKRCPESIQFCGVLEAQVVNGGHFSFTEIALVAVKPFNNDQGKLQVFDSTVASEHGVTVLHFLSELKGTEFDDGANDAM